MNRLLIGYQKHYSVSNNTNLPLIALIGFSIKLIDMAPKDLRDPGSNQQMSEMRALQRVPSEAFFH